MDSWINHMPQGMFLKSVINDIAAPASGSSLGDFCRDTCIEAFDDWHPVPIASFIDYSLSFQERNVPTVEQTMVVGVTPATEGFHIALADGETLTARSVIDATGHLRFRHVPQALRASGGGEDGLVSHVSDHTEYSRFCGKDVAVVGAGQSALECAVQLQEIGANVHLLVRNPELHWGGPPIEGSSIFRRLFKPRTPYGPGWSHVFVTEAPTLIRHLPVAMRLALVGRTYGPSGAWWLKSRFSPDIHTSLSTTVDSLCERNGKAVLRLRSPSGETRSLAVDHVIAGTGYAVDVDRLSHLDPAIRNRVARAGDSGSPRLSATFESTVPGLYFAGLTAAATFGPLLRFVHGTNFSAPTIAAAIAGTRIPAQVGTAA